MDREFSCYFLDDCNDREYYCSEQLRSCFFWLYSEPCSLGPVGLGRNWFFLLHPQKNSLPNHGAMEWFAVINNFPLPINSPYSIFIICWSTISLPHPPCKQKWCRQAILPAQLWWCGVNTNRQNKTIMMKVGAILVALMPNWGPSWPGLRNGHWPASLMSRPLLGPQNWWTNDAGSHCHMQSWKKNRPRATFLGVDPIVLDGSMKQHAASPTHLDDSILWCISGELEARES